VISTPSDWLNSLPPGWIKTRFNRDVIINEGQVDPTTEPWSSMILIAPNHIESATGKVIALESASEQGADSGKYLAWAGQVLYSKIRPALNKVAIAPVDCLCSADMYAISGRPGIVDNKFLMYWMLALPFSRYASLMSDRVKMPKVNREEVAAAPWTRPPIEQQRAISDFLDRETERLDALIAKQCELVRFLGERRSAVIDRIVWSGLNVNASYSLTGVDTAPSAPSHWSRLRNKNLFRERVDVSVGGSEELLTVSHITGVTPRSEKNVNMFEAESLEGYKIVRVGDLAINTMWAWMGALGVSGYEGIASPSYGVYEPLQGVARVAKYFDYLYRSSPYVLLMLPR
jgi:restriction endonuclease S subunit